MGEVQRAYQAKLDLIEVWVQVARHDATAADRLIERFEAAIAQLALHVR